MRRESLEQDTKRPSRSSAGNVGGVMGGERAGRADNSYELFVAKRFDALESRFNSGVRTEDSRLRAILDVIRAKGSRRILDLGCGKGRFARELAKEGLSVVGTDISRKMLAYSKELRCVQSNVVQLPFAPESFDMVVAIEVIEHIPIYKLETLLSELRRVVRPGGCVLVIDKNLASLNDRWCFLPNVMLKRIDEWRGFWMYERSDPVRERWFWPLAFARRLENHFGRVEVQYLRSASEEGNPLFSLLPFARKLTLWIGTEPGGRRV